MTNKHAVLIVNLGTPKSNSVQDVKVYLKEFLNDPYVITLPSFLRYILVNMLIVPFRSKNSAKAYSEIWTERGSPLLYISQDFTKKIQKIFNENPDNKYTAFLAMRYGAPSLENALEEINRQNFNEVTVVPMYPQYADSATKTVINKIKELNNKNIKINFIEDFYDKDFYIESSSKLIKDEITKNNIDNPHIIYSFHGIPKNTNYCEDNRLCYKAQCRITAELISKKLGLNKEDYTVAFQSRLGKAEWIKPYLTDTLNILKDKLPNKKFIIATPGFTVDCLETLEEIDMQMREIIPDFIKVPCLNDNLDWCNAFAEYIINN